MMKRGSNRLTARTIDTSGPPPLMIETGRDNPGDPDALTGSLWIGGELMGTWESLGPRRETPPARIRMAPGWGPDLEAPSLHRAAMAAADRFEEIRGRWPRS